MSEDGGRNSSGSRSHVKKELVVSRKLADMSGWDFTPILTNVAVRYHVNFTEML